MKVFIIVALTADGFIAKSANHVADWTSSEDKKRFVQLTKEAGVMVMGSRTFATIGRALPGRQTLVYTKNRRSIIVDGVETTSESPVELIERLRIKGVAGVAVCGGATIYDLFMRAGVVDELYLTIEPVLFGTGTPLFARPLDVKLELIEMSQPNASGSIFSHYRVVR